MNRYLPTLFLVHLLLKELIQQESRIFTKTLTGYEIAQDDFNEEREWYHGVRIVFGTWGIRSVIIWNLVA